MNDTSTDPLAVSPFFIAFRTCFIIFLALLIICGNILSIVVTRLVPDLADSTKILMTSLAVADLTVGCLTAFSAVGSAMNRWPFGDIACHVHLYTGVLVIILSELSLIGLNIERYIAVTRPYKFPVWCTQSRIIVSLTLATTVLFSLQLTISITLRVPVVYSEAVAACDYASASSELNLFLLLTCVVLPVFIMMSIYYHIIRISREHVKRINENDPNNRNKVHQGHKALKTFVVVTVAFAVCFTPRTISRIIEDYTNVQAPPWIQLILTWLFACNSVCNVFIYYLFNRSYRQKAKTIITKSLLLCCKSSVEPVNIQV